MRFLFQGVIDVVIASVRHYVRDMTGVNELGTIAKQILSAARRSKIEYRLMLNWPSGLAEEICAAMLSPQAELLKAGIAVNSFPGKGSGYAFIKCVFDCAAEINCARSDSEIINFMIDGNQYDLDDERVIRAIENIAERISEGRCVLGMALRDCVELSADPDLDALRRIEEFYHLNACPNIYITNPQAIPEHNIHPAYRRYGDIIPGLIGFNLASPVFEDMVHILHEDIKQTSLIKFEGDAYIVMLAGALASHYGMSDFHTPGFYSEVVPTNRVSRGCAFKKEYLTEKAANLARTHVGRNYRQSVEDTFFTREVELYFPSAIVEEARALILKGFTRASFQFESQLEQKGDLYASPH